VHDIVLHHRRAFFWYRLSLSTTNTYTWPWCSLMVVWCCCCCLQLLVNCFYLVSSTFQSTLSKCIQHTKCNFITVPSYFITFQKLTFNMNFSTLNVGTILTNSLRMLLTAHHWKVKWLHKCWWQVVRNLLNVSARC